MQNVPVSSAQAWLRPAYTGRLLQPLGTNKENKMTGYDKLLAEVEKFQASHRRSDSPRFDIEPPYDLFPQLGSTVIPYKFHWPTPWANADRKGAYALLDNEANVLYVGKASMGSCFAARFVAYFAYENDRSCKIKHPNCWSRTPRYVLTIAVPIETPWEAPGLEEFLIRKLQPPDNGTGRVLVDPTVKLDS